MSESEGQLKTLLGHFQMRWLVCLRMVDMFLQEAWELQSGCFLSLVHLSEGKKKKSAATLYFSSLRVHLFVPKFSLKLSKIVFGR